MLPGAVPCGGRRPPAPHKTHAHARQRTHTHHDMHTDAHNAHVRAHDTCTHVHTGHMHTWHAARTDTARSPSHVHPRRPAPADCVPLPQCRVRELEEKCRAQSEQFGLLSRDLEKFRQHAGRIDLLGSSTAPSDGPPPPSKPFSRFMNGLAPSIGTGRCPEPCLGWAGDVAFAPWRAAGVAGLRPALSARRVSTSAPPAVLSLLHSREGRDPWGGRTQLRGHERT